MPSNAHADTSSRNRRFHASVLTGAWLTILVVLVGLGSTAAVAALHAGACSGSGIDPAAGMHRCIDPSTRSADAPLTVASCLHDTTAPSGTLIGLAARLPAGSESVDDDPNFTKTAQPNRIAVALAWQTPRWADHTARATIPLYLIYRSLLC